MYTLFLISQYGSCYSCYICGFDRVLKHPLLENMLRSLLKSFPIVLSLSLFANLQPLLATSILEEIKETGVLKVGLRQDAPPISYRNGEGMLTGYCVDAIAALKQKLQDELETPYEIIVNIYTSSLTNRFELVADGTVHLECGPNSIHNDTDNFIFSQHFFISGTHFLINTNRRRNLDHQGSLDNITVGILPNTTTETFVGERYPQTTLQSFYGTTGTFRAIEALEDRIDAFASDGILLIGEIVTRGLPLNRYQLVPLEGLSCEYYGMILPEGDGDWEAFVNSVLASEEAERIWQDWFEVKFPYIKIETKFCN